MHHNIYVLTFRNIKGNQIDADKPRNCNQFHNRKMNYIIMTHHNTGIKPKGMIWIIAQCKGRKL